ncbi:MAG: sulfotransferase [Sedimenticola sp.]
MPESSVEEIDKAIRHYQSGNYKKALKIYKSELKKTPGNHHVIRLMGLLENKRGNAEKAVRLLREAIRLAPETPAYYCNLGDIYRSNTRHAEAIDNYRIALQKNSGYAIAHNNMGISLIELGQYDEAVDCFRRVIDNGAGNVDTLVNLGHALDKIGKASEAENIFKRAVGLDPANIKAYLGLASINLERWHLKTAVDLCQSAMQINPGDASVHVALGKAQLAMNFWEDALASFTKAVDLDPSNYEANVGIGHILKDRGNTEGAMTAFRKAIDIKPDDPRAHRGLGNVYGDLGELDTAAELYRKAVGIDPKFTVAYRHLANLKRYSSDDNDISVMESLLAEGELSENQKLHLSFALGKAHDDLGEYEKAIDYFIEANRLGRKERGYSSQREEQSFTGIQETFTRDFFQGHSDSGCSDDTPIFILGMPRSGTSLVEQILASHPQVYGAGELSALKDVINTHCEVGSDDWSIGECIRRLPDEMFVTMGERYLQALRQHDKDARYITDKMPHNFRYVGLIRLILPNAKVIHCRRNPMDTCLSIFKQYFKYGHSYSRDLNDLGSYYKLYQQLMAHWESVLPGFVYSVDYENLVFNQEEGTRQLLQYCGLPWDDACLEFHKTRRRVGTASNAQVRRKIFTSSVDGWKKYGDRLSPLYKAIHG